jgi:hypothetical protein
LAEAISKCASLTSVAFVGSLSKIVFLSSSPQPSHFLNANRMLVAGSTFSPASIGKFFELLSQHTPLVRLDFEGLS